MYNKGNERRGSNHVRKTKMAYVIKTTDGVVVRKIASKDYTYARVGREVETNKVIYTGSCSTKFKAEDLYERYDTETGNLLRFKWEAVIPTLIEKKGGQN
jgi:hypothetical protein